MSPDRATTTPTTGSRARLLLGASLVALVTAGATAPARAQSLGALMSATHQVAAAATSATPQPSPTSPVSAGMAAALLRQQQYQAQVASAQALIEQTQAAAQAAAKALNQNQAAGIANGLAPGGLVPAVNKITPVTSDPTPAGIETWQGASLPTASASNPDDVTIVQTAPRAVLSWTTFNVGQSTTLTFQQEQNGVAQPNWIVLNRVVGQLDPNTGLRNPALAPAPSEILGSIKAVGTVLVINQNGIIFGPTSQVNTQALIASTLEVGRAFDIDEVTGGLVTRTIGQRDSEFLDLGLLGYAETNPASPGATFSAQDIAAGNSVAAEPNIEGAVTVQAGASLTSADTGFLMLIAPKVTNAGALISPDGEVALQSGRQVTLVASSGDADSVDPDVRGLVVTGAIVNSTDPTDYVDNTGLIEADRGYVSVGATDVGAVLDSGFIASTTSVSRNGYVNIFGADIQISPNAVISIAPDSSTTTIPQDPTSLAAFQPSIVRIGDVASRNSEDLPGSQINIGSNSLIYAPSATISIGADSGASGPNDAQFPDTSRLFVDTGAVIDAAGLPDVIIPASRNSIEISPVKGNELADSPAFRNGFLNGATVFVDPRLSGVNANGVAWVGSPLISAAAYAQQVGVSVSELMTTGGNVTLGALSYSGTASKGFAPDVIVKPGAVVDISGGWKTYQAGEVIQTYLVDANGQVIPISQANPDDIYVAVYNGYAVSQPRWGITQTYLDPMLSGAMYEGQYTEGLDAGSLTVKASAIALDGQVFASAFPGPEQILGAQPGTASGSIYGDSRPLQAAPSQLPAGGYLNIQALDLISSSNNGNTSISQPVGSAGGGDISVVDQTDYAPLASETSGLAYGEPLSIAANGSLTLPTRPDSSLLPSNRLDVISLDADALSAMGLGELSLSTSGKIDVAAGANVTLAPGGVFNALAGPTANGGGAITVEGSITAPSGAINLTTGQFTGSAFAPVTTLAPGDFDVVITGTLDAAGRWVNDNNAAAGAITGTAWLGGGSITIAPAPRVTATSGIIGATCAAAPCSTDTTDVSGSILIDPGALIDLSGGGYVSPTGGFILTAKGGSLSLYEDTNYFQLSSDGFTPVAGNLPGFRAPGITLNGTPYLPLNPGAITARVDIADGSIKANGFGGGGTFTLADSSFAFGPSDPTSGAALPLNFFSQAGFANYKITTYETGFEQNSFTTTVGGVTTPIGGYNAYLTTDVATVGAGQSLDLTQSYFSPLLNESQISALRGLATGGNLYRVMAPTVPTDAWDRMAVNLTLGGLTELDVAKGGQVIGEAGGALTVGELYNQGLIRIPGGTLTQSEVLPAFYASSTTLGVSDPASVTATQAATQPIYVLGDLPAGVGMLLAPGSVTDLSGEAIVNPRAAPTGSVNPADFTSGTVIAGGALTTAGAFANGASPFATDYGANAVYSLQPVQLSTSGLVDALTAAPASRIDLAGATASFDEPTGATSVIGGQLAPTYAPTPVWSNGGALTLGSGGTLTGAQIDAHGGASPYSLGGTLTVLDPILYQSDTATPTFDAISADMINSASPVSAGFSSFVAQGELNSVGNVTLSVSRQVFVESAPVGDVSNLASASFRDSNAPDIASGGILVINAPYIALVGSFQSLLTPPSSTPGPNSIQLNAQDIDIVGAARFDSSVGAATLTASQAVRLFGVEPWQQTFNIDPGSVSSSLIGQLAVGGNLTVKAGQVYPTTGSSFTITSAAADGQVDFQADGPTPATPYSAGGSLTVLAANIDQAGVVRVPLGALTLGANATQLAASGFGAFAPATTSLTLESGSITSVSADGLSIPYGTTTDQTEWYFSPTSGSALSAPPAGVLALAGGKVSVLSGATVDLKGGGDVYAYEFISGTGGSRDVLDQFNPDQFSSNNGYQYPDGRQIYAIVPGLSNAAVAAYDPIYSANYTPLYGPSQAGLSVYLNASPDLAAGWYTLLPAYYAMLPGGIRVVQDTSASTPAPTAGATLDDGTVVTTGYFGVAGAGSRNALLNVFDLQTQAVVLTESDIALTSGDANFAALAAHNGTPTPQLPIDAGRLIINPLTSLSIAGTFDTAPASGGRGSEVDISGTSLTIEPGATAAAAPGTIVISDASLEDLDASSLLLGGVRTDNADGTTSLDVTSTSITVDSGVDLAAPEILMAVDGKNSVLRIDNGASIVATGAVTNESNGDYVIDGLFGTARVQDAQGGFLRVSNGPQRLLTRLDIDTAIPAGALVVGDSTLSGAAVEIESRGALSIATNANIAASYLALGAGKVSIGESGGLSITSALLTEIDKAQTLTIQTPNAIDFAPGAYAFGNLTLDAPGLDVNNNGAVTLDATSLTLANSSLALAGCGASGSPACGSGRLTLSATTIAFDSGAIFTFGAGHAVTLDASGGVFADGAASLGVGAAALTINAPFVGDRGTGLADATLPSLTLQTTGAVQIASATPATAFTASAGTPGSSLTIDGASVAISGTELRATAGALRIDSAGGIAISGGALLSTPGYAKVFGDAADPTTVSAPGGLLSLTALDGDIAISDDSSLAIGGGQGQAGTLSLIAQNGQVYAYHGATSDVVSLDTVFAANAPGGGASLVLDTGGSFDLSAFAAGIGSQFTGVVAVRSGQGNLTLAAGDSLTATSVQLTADGGAVIDSGKIDTTGVNGGDVSLYGATGVTLTSGGVIDAEADGYGATDTRQATGGAVALGTDGTGAIAVDAGAIIDVAALNPGNRLVNLDRSNGTYYDYVAGDQGGTVTFRAPVIDQAGHDTVNVAVAGAVTGASSVVLEGFQHFNLTTLASNPDYIGVSISNGTATLDLAATSAGKINALADVNGPVVQFVQTFDVAADYGALGGLASQANFQARPGIELDYSGNIVLKSNWNLGAGVVNVAGAVAAGLMTPDPGLPGRYVAVPGDEGKIFDDYTSLTYRVGGAVNGAPGVLTIRAGGALDLQGSITDGFFQFGDQTDPGYLNQVLGGGDRNYQASLAPGCATGDCSTVGTWAPNETASNFVWIVFPGAAGLNLNPYQIPAAPYSAAANSPAALGSMANGGGDPLGSAELFPLIDGGTTPVSSWSYQLVAGADLTGAAGRPSVNPMTVTAGSNFAVTVEGQHVYGYGAVAGTVGFDDSLDLQAGGVALAADQWLTAFIASNPGLQADSYTTLQFGTAPKAARPILLQLADTFFKTDHPGVGQFIDGNRRVTTTLSTAAKFMAYVSDNFDLIASDYRAPPETGLDTATTYATAPTLVRTGTGSISLAASGDIDLRNGAQPTVVNSRGELVDVTDGQPSLGGTAIYTAGRIANLGVTTATDVDTGQVLSVNLGAGSAGDVNVFSTDPQASYDYGAGSGDQPQLGFAGVLIANPIYAEGGGSISLSAGQDVLSRRDTLLESQLGDVGVIQAPGFAQTNPWIGVGNQPWRTGVIGGDATTGYVVNAQIDPQLFTEGVGTLGGGGISIRAGGDITDLSTVATDSLTTASIGGGTSLTALVTLGGGDVSLFAGANILGGRLDVASGTANVTALGAIESAGLLLENITTPVDNTLRIRLADATVNLYAGGDVSLQGISALGVYAGADSLNADGFYSKAAGVSIVADGSVAIANSGVDVVTPTSPITTGNTTSTVYPGSLQAVSLTGDLGIATASGVITQASAVLLQPSPTGTLTLLADGNITQTTIAMLDSDPTLLPGAFSSFETNGSALIGGIPLVFPAVLPNTPDVVLRNLHNSDITHADDPIPNRIVAGGDILDMILSSPKQTRIYAGMDIINMAFFGQNLSGSDITRIVAGRDITATTALEAPVLAGDVLGEPLPAVQGDTFILGGPGALFVEAGRDLGPFLNSAVTDGYGDSESGLGPTGVLTWGNGIITVGNQWNPWLPAQSADIYTEFGVGKGQDFAGLISSYLSPTAFASQPGYLFEQSTNAAGVQTPISSEQIYALTLTQWLGEIAPSLIADYDLTVGATKPPSNAPALIQYIERLASGGTTTTAEALTYLPLLADQTMPLIPWMQLHESAALIGAYGTKDVTYQQAFNTFDNLPPLVQQEYLLKNVYFNELSQTSVPSSPSYLDYSRGYLAVNTLFPGSYGYTQNTLGGGPGGASVTVATGNLDLRLATIETAQGGDIFILGPGGRVLAGSTVSTSVQASRRVYSGGALYSGEDNTSPFTAQIMSIPVGYEGVITLGGGSIDSFTDQDFLLNQSRAFTVDGGSITIWSSNADVNAGQGPRTTADVPPVVVNIDADGFSQEYTVGAVSGAGIGAFASDGDGFAPSVYLIAPRGVVDAGAAGVRSAGNVFIAAFQVANADNVQASGTVSGVQGPAAVNVSAQTSADSASGAAAQAAQAAANAQSSQDQRPLIFVEVLGYLSDEDDSDSDDSERRKKK